jgi:hypothetical protein
LQYVPSPQFTAVAAAQGTPWSKGVQVESIVWGDSGMQYPLWHRRVLEQRSDCHA